MKKVTATLGAIALAATMSACGTPDTPSNSQPTSEAVEERSDAMPWLFDQFGAEPQEILRQDPNMWYGYVTDAYVDRGNLHVLLQVDRKADKALAERAQDALVNFIQLGDDPRVSDVSYVVVEDGAGVVITQKMVR